MKEKEGKNPEHGSCGKGYPGQEPAEKDFGDAADSWVWEEFFRMVRIYSG